MKKEPSIEELCKPLSAKVIPERLRYGLGSNIPLTEEQARGNARTSTANGIWRLRQKKGKK